MVQPSGSRQRTTKFGILLFKFACESLRLSTSGSHGSEVTASSAKTRGLLVVKKKRDVQNAQGYPVKTI